MLAVVDIRKYYVCSIKFIGPGVVVCDVGSILVYDVDRTEGGDCGICLLDDFVGMS